MFYITIMNSRHITRYAIHETADYPSDVEAIFKPDCARADGGYGLYVDAPDYPDWTAMLSDPTDMLVECRGMVWRWDSDGTERKLPFDWEPKRTCPLVLKTTTDQQEAM